MRSPRAAAVWILMIGFALVAAYYFGDTTATDSDSLVTAESTDSGVTRNPRE